MIGARCDNSSDSLTSSIRARKGYGTMMYGRRLTALALLMCGVLAAGGVGCATKYRAEDFTRGYSIFQIDPTTYRVSLHSTAYQRVPGLDRDYLMYRCAELTLNAGYDYFLVLPPAAVSQENSPADAGSSAEDRGVGAPAESGFNPASALQSSKTSRTGESVVIRLLRTGKADHPTALAARDVLQSLRSRIQ
jgi:hypothetical protein